MRRWETRRWMDGWILGKVEVGEGHGPVWRSLYITYSYKYIPGILPFSILRRWGFWQLTYEYVRYGGREAICKARSVSEVRKEIDISKGRSKVVMSLISGGISWTYQPLVTLWWHCIYSSTFIVDIYVLYIQRIISRALYGRTHKGRFGMQMISRCEKRKPSSVHGTFSIRIQKWYSFNSIGLEQLSCPPIQSKKL